MNTTSYRMLTSALVMVCIAFCVSCSGSQKKKSNALTDELKIPEHFKYIPADSPYVVTSIKSLPYKELGWRVDAQYEYSVKSLSEMSKQAIQGYGSFEAMPAEQRLLTAITEELEAHNTVDSLKQLGITTEGHFSMYGIGVFPAFRLELDDASKFEAMLQRIEARVGESMPTKQVGKYKVRYIDDPKMMMPIIVTETELLFGFSSAEFGSEFVEYLVGTKKPAKNLYEDNKLLAMQKQYKMLPYVSGYADFKGLTSAMLSKDPNSLVVKTIESTGEQIPEVSQACKDEYSQLTQDVPRAVFGYTDVSRTNVKGFMALEVVNELPGRLKAMKAPAPAYDSKLRKEALFALALGFNVDKTIEVLREEAKRIGSAPYQCENLAWINESAENFYFSAQQVPPTFRSMLGTSLILSNLDFVMDGQPRVTALDFVGLMQNSDPETFFAAMSMFFPEILGGVEIKPDLQPTSLQLPVDLTNNIPGIPVPMMVMSQQALGLSMGSAMQGEASKYTKTAPEADTPLFGMTYDLAKIFRLIVQAMPANGGAPDVRNNMEMMAQTYQNFGPVTFSLDIRDGGFFMDYDVTMIPAE